MRSRTEGLAGLALVLLLAGCPEDAPPPPPPPKPVVTPPVAGVEDAGAAEEELEGALVLSFAGIVEVRRKGSDTWLALRVGDAVQVGDVVRTGADGELKLSFSVSEVAVKGDSELQLTMLDPTEVRATVSGGGAAEAGGGKVTLTAGDTTATSEGGKVAMTFDGTNAIATSLDGAATVQSGDKSVALKPGESTAARDGALSRPKKLPKVVKLTVHWPKQLLTNKPQVVLTGQASAYARVIAEGRPVEVTPDGRFKTTVTLKRGKQTVAFKAVDPLGRKVVRAKQFVLDPDAPSIRGTVEYQ